MKKHKSILLAALIIGMISLLFTDCTKKGKDDPLISLRTRKNRITGTWNMTKGNTESKQAGNTTVCDYTGDSYVVVETVGSSILRGSGVGANLTIKLYADGNMDYSSFLFPFQAAFTTTIGAWNFMGSSGSYKNKERIALSFNKNSASSNLVYEIVELRNKKMVLKRIGDYPGLNFSEEFTFEQD